MLESIHIKNTASYDATGINLENLKKVNFIYGANGSGKTTISNYLSDESSAEFINCFLKWENDVPLRCFIYNKNFRKNNFMESDIPGIFTLGQATNEELEKLAADKQKLDGLDKDLVANRKSKEKLESDISKESETLKKVLWEGLYKKYKDVFDEAYRGCKVQEKLKAKAIELFTSYEGSEVVEKIDDLKKRAATVFGEKPQVRNTILDIDFSELIDIEMKDTWDKAIVGKKDLNISGLIQKLGHGDWINSGRKYIGDTTVCPFCQRQTIDDEFRKEIENYFDEEFENNIHELESDKISYIEAAKIIAGEIEQIIANNVGFVEDVKIASLLESFKLLINSNIVLMNSKLKEPSVTITLNKVLKIASDIKEQIKMANEMINKNNDIANNFSSAKPKLVNDIWIYLINENLTILAAYNRKVSALRSGLAALESNKKRMTTDRQEIINRIQEQSKNLTGVQPTVDEINRLLSGYGFNNFRIVQSKEKDNYYQIQRSDGELASQTLSEGEETFITFLYFLQLVKGSNDNKSVSGNRIVVVDDPVSSLDSSILFVVSSLLKDIINETIKNENTVKQIIVLTHNVYFHKEISYWGNGNSTRKDVHYWILRKRNNISNIQCYEMENPIRSSYELLWEELKRADINSGITIQNIMRRIIENYFKLLGKFKDEQIISKFEDYESQEICRSLLCWINDGSHCIPDDLFIESPTDLTDKYQEVFRGIFEKLNQLPHYNMMMGIEA